MNNFAASSLDHYSPDREKHATRLSALLNFGAYLLIGFYLLSHPLQLSTPDLVAPEKISLTFELVEAPLPIPAPEIPPEPEAVLEPAPLPAAEPEPVEVVEPEPEPKTEPVPVVKPKPKPKPKQEAKVTAKAAPAAQPQVSAAPPRQNANKFANDFLRVVEKSKFYPQSARRAGITGTVKVRVTFDRQGLVSGYSLVPGNYDSSLGEAALATMAKAKTRWSPKSGGPSSLVVPIGFRLK